MKNQKKDNPEILLKHAPLSRLLSYARPEIRSKCIVKLSAKKGQLTLNLSEIGLQDKSSRIRVSTRIDVC